MALLISYLHFAAFAVFLHMAFYVLMRGPRNAASRICSALCACMAIWAGAFTFVHNPLTPRPVAVFLVQVSALGGIPFISLFLWFVCAFTEKKKLLRHPLFYVAMIGPWIVLLGANYGGSPIVILPEQTPRAYGWSIALSRSVWSVVYYLYAYPYALTGLYMLFHYSFTAQDKTKKRQALTIGIAIVCLLCANGVILGFSEWFGGPLPYLGDLSNLVWCVGLVYAMTRLQLFSYSPESAADNILKTMSDSVLMIDTSGIIRNVNSAAVHLLGANPAGPVGRRLSEFFFFSDGAGEAFAERALSDVVNSTEAMCAPAAGSACPVLVSSSPLRDQQGTVKGFVCVARDISELRDLEKQVIRVEEQELARLGRDLHDGLGQLLTGIAFTCKAMEQRVSLGSPIESADMSGLTGMVNSAAEQLRGMSRGMLSPTNESQRLVDALEELAETVQSVFRIPCEYYLPAGISLPSDACSHLYRIAQEAINNAARHAQANRIYISLSYEDGQAVLEIRDDGLGITQPPQHHAGMGLRTMQYRARLIGATLTLKPAEPKGTLVKCTLPLQPDRTGQRT